MKNFVVALVLAVVGLALPHPSQAAGAIAGIPGYYDTTTGTFVPMVVPKVVPLASVARTGTVKVSITLSVEAAIGADEPISCQASISAFDASFDNSASVSYGGVNERNFSRDSPAANAAREASGANQSRGD